MFHFKFQTGYPNILIEIFRQTLKVQTNRMGTNLLHEN